MVFVSTIKLVHHIQLVIITKKVSLNDRTRRNNPFFQGGTWRRREMRGKEEESESEERVICVWTFLDRKFISSLSLSLFHQNYKL